MACRTPRHRCDGALFVAVGSLLIVSILVAFLSWIRIDFVAWDAATGSSETMRSYIDLFGHSQSCSIQGDLEFCQAQSGTQCDVCIWLWVVATAVNGLLLLDMMGAY